MNRQDIEERLRELGIYSQYYYRLELKPLSQIVNIDEKVNSIITGVVDGRRRLVAVTDYRIIIVSSGVVSGGEVIIIRREAVKNWVFNKKFLLSSVVIETEERNYEIRQTQGNQKELFTWAMEQPIKTFGE